MNRKLFLRSLVNSLLSLANIMFCTILSALVMLVLHYQKESPVLSAIKGGIIIALLVIKIIHTYWMKGSNGLSMRYVIAFAIDVAGMLLLMFAAKHLVTFLIIIIIWLALSAFMASVFMKFLTRLQNNQVDFKTLFTILEKVGSTHFIPEFNDIPDDELLEVIFSYVQNIVGGATGKDEEEMLDQVDPVYVKTYLIETLNRIVTDDGMGRYFQGPSGYFAMETAEALKDIGASRAYEILSKAIQILTAEPCSQSGYKEIFNNQILKGVAGDWTDKLKLLSGDYLNQMDAIRKALTAYIRNKKPVQEE